MYAVRASPVRPRRRSRSRAGRVGQVVPGEVAAAEDLIDEARARPRAVAHRHATARFSSTTGVGFTANRASYRTAIRAQSVAAGVSAPAWTAAIAAWSA
ncbi:unnamed protein product [Gemmataceae bacterium]|nr:unnamed protein product [Gemmataceae bacterium]VTU01260.1 unnamed protein product [Gemmataceae bacterium]